MGSLLHKINVSKCRLSFVWMNIWNGVSLLCSAAGANANTDFVMREKHQIALWLKSSATVTTQNGWGTCNTLYHEGARVIHSTMKFLTSRWSGKVFELETRVEKTFSLHPLSWNLRNEQNKLLERYMFSIMILDKLLSWRTTFLNILC